MLPTPVTFHHSRGLSISRPNRRLRDVLVTRARITNLGFFLLLATASLSLLVNLCYYFSSPTATPLSSAHTIPHTVLDAVARSDEHQLLDHLVLVPGHAIWKGGNPKDVLDAGNWLLEPYQSGRGRIEAFYNHVARGVDVALNDERALLVFSGGQTKKVSTTTEAESYLRLAQASGLLPAAHEEPFLRATTEDDALDSFQNLLFSVARFHEYTGRYPSQITVVGYEFKRKRFTDLHRAALRWPEDRFHYIGIDADGEDLTAARMGERQNGFLPYSKDVYGCHDFLLSKRRLRNPFNRFHPYFTSAPELAGLFNWCPGPNEGGQTALYTGPLPWDDLL